MTDQTNAPEAPASAVEATKSTEQALQGPPNNPIETQASGEAVTAAPAPSPEGSPSSEGEATPANAHTEGSSKEAAAGQESAAEASATGQGEAAKRKRRRRRRKKAGAAEGAQAKEGESAQPGAEKAEKAEKPAREGQGGVFARFFEGGQAGKRHAFSAGEVVAGRVVHIGDGAFTVDLFGKATAFVDIFEPHEVPVIPEPEPAAPEAAAAEAQPAGEAGAATPAADGTVAAEQAAGEGTGEAATEQVEASAAVAAPLAADAPAAPAESSGEAPASEGQPEAAAAAVEAPSAGDQAPEASEAAQAAPEASQAATAPAEAAEAASAEAAADTGEAQESEATAEGQESGAAAEAQEEAAHEESEPEPEPEPPPPPELGSIFRGRVGSVSESGHIVLVNRIIDTQAAKQRIARAREQRRRVRGVVFGFNRGGFDVLVEGIRVFCPASGMSLGPIENPEELLGQRLEFTVPPAKAGTHGFVVSRRGILERQQRKAAKQLFRSLQPGQRLKGRVTQVREFGLFVDLGGVEGLVHQSELSFSRGVRPQDVAKVGDEVEVQVLRVGEGQTRKERERVSLSIKALQEDPWAAHAELLEPGNVVTGKVVRTTDFGAFIELAPQIEGLLHISELGREVKHASQVLSEGQELRVVIERADRKARRISLSKLSQAEEKALEAGTEVKSARPPKPGQQLTVVVDKVEHAGLVVQIPGVFGRRGRGFIPNSEMGTERGTDHRKGFPPGTQIPVKAIGVDRDGGFRFSRKALLAEEEKRAVQDYRREVARQGLGTFGDLLRAKLEGSKQN